MGIGFKHPNPFLGFKQSGTAWHTDSFQRGTDGKADGLIRAAFIRYQQIRRQGIKPTRHTLNAGVKGF
jgi:hypothetical protein